MPEGWEWDESLHQGSAVHYVRGRFPYAPGLADALAERLSLDGRGRLLDLGCGPGVVALALAHLFEAVVGVDPDRAMLAEAGRLAVLRDVGNASWLEARAEELTDEVGRFRMATFGQSFHWMDRPRVAVFVHRVLEPAGVFVHINENNSYVTAAALDSSDLPTPPYQAIAALVNEHLGPERRAGRGLLRYGTPGREADVFAAAGFYSHERFIVPGAGPTTRAIEDLVDWTYSRSDSAPHLFGSDRERFDRELREVLRSASPSGSFAELFPDTEVEIFLKS